MKVEERFLKYVSICTTSDEDSGTVPSSECQWNLAHLLMEEMKEIGMQNVDIDENGYVYGVIPATPGCEEKKALGLIAHMDTSPECSGENIQPQIISDYSGEDICLGESGVVLKISEFPHLKFLKGKTLITTDGTTLLGADDKAGIAEIMTAAEQIIEENIPHGKICIGFTVDEEIGSGAELFNLEKFGADYAFTLDGDAEGEIQYENFNAATAIFEIRGNNVHPGSAKGVMVNSQAIAMEIHSMLPMDEKPEYTELYEGFFHLFSMNGTVEKTTLKYLIREFDEAEYHHKQELLQEITHYLNKKYNNCIELKIEESYNNMKEMIKPSMWLIDYAAEACKQADVEPIILPIRGGTDGARLSFRGLPCPNLGTGGHAFHGNCEHIAVESMEKVVEITKNLVLLFAK